MLFWPLLQQASATQKAGIRGPAPGAQNFSRRPYAREIQFCARNITMAPHKCYLSHIRQEERIAAQSAGADKP